MSREIQDVGKSFLALFKSQDPDLKSLHPNTRGYKDSTGSYLEIAYKPDESDPHLMHCAKYLDVLVANGAIDKLPDPQIKDGISYLTCKVLNIETLKECNKEYRERDDSWLRTDGFNSQDVADILWGTFGGVATTFNKKFAAGVRFEHIPDYSDGTSHGFTSLEKVGIFYEPSKTTNAKALQEFIKQMTEAGIIYDNRSSRSQGCFSIDEAQVDQLLYEIRKFDLTKSKEDKYSALTVQTGDSPRELKGQDHIHMAHKRDLSKISEGRTGESESSLSSDDSNKTTVYHGSQENLASNYGDSPLTPDTADSNGSRQRQHEKVKKQAGHAESLLDTDLPLASPSPRSAPEEKDTGKAKKFTEQHKSLKDITPATMSRAKSAPTPTQRG